MDTRIALQVQRPNIVSPADLLSLKDLQTRHQLNQFNLEQAPEEARLNRELKLSEIGLRKGQFQQSQQEVHRKEAVRQATTMLRAPPEKRAAIYQGMLQWVASQDPAKAAQMPQQYDDAMLPKFEALVYGEVGADQAAGAEAERQAYPAAPQVPLSQVGQPPMTMDQDSGAMVGGINLEQPQGVPLGEGLPPEEQAFQDQLETTGQAAVPAVGVTGIAPDETPDGLRKEAKAIEARGGKANYDKAQNLRARADKLDDRIFKEREQTKFQSLGDIGVTFNPAEGKFYKDGKEISSSEIQKLSLQQNKAKAANVNVGMNASDAAKAELLNQGISDIEEFKGIIMPNGKVDREIVLGLSTPGLAGVPGTDSRIAYSLIYNSIEAKLRAESGAAVPEEEVKRMAARFIPSPLDNDETIKSKIRRMEAFLRGSFGRIKNAGEPTTEKGAAPKIDSGWSADDEKRLQELERKRAPK